MAVLTRWLVAVQTAVECGKPKRCSRVIQIQISDQFKSNDLFLIYPFNRIWPRMTYDAKHCTRWSSAVQGGQPQTTDRGSFHGHESNWTWMIEYHMVTNTDRILEILSKLFETAVRTAIYRG